MSRKPPPHKEQDSNQSHKPIFSAEIGSNGHYGLSARWPKGLFKKLWPLYVAAAIIGGYELTLRVKKIEPEPQAVTQPVVAPGPTPSPSPVKKQASRKKRSNKRQPNLNGGGKVRPQLNNLPNDDQLP